MRLNLNHLETLRALSRHGTLTAASGTLGYTPGALSQQLDALERSIGSPVVRRVGRLVVLTDVGKALLAHAEILLTAEDQAVRDIRALDGQAVGELVIGTWGTTAAALVAPAVALSRTRHPRLTIKSTEVDVDSAATAVQFAEVDLAFGLEYPDSPVTVARGVVVELLLEERFGIGVATDDPTWPHTVALADLADVDWILPDGQTHYGRAMRAACRSAGFEPHVQHQVTDTAASLRMAAAGLGVAPITELMLTISPHVAIRRVEVLETISRRLVLILPAHAREGTATAALASTIRMAVAAIDPRTAPASSTADSGGGTVTS